MNNELKTRLYQMFILGLEGENLQDNPNLQKAIDKNLGGIILFTQNIKNEQQTKKLISDIKSKAKTPLFLSIDQEGGRVERTENLFGGKKFLSAKFAAQKGEKFLLEQTEQIARLIKELGFNLNFAPVLDVNTNSQNPIIGERAFGAKTEEVIKCGKIVVETYLNNQIIPCTKHFPGHGDANVDSHISLPKINLNLQEMEKIHIKPFKEVSSPTIMVAHLHCSAFDSEEVPSSLSKNVIDYLKNELKYEGLIITDDMVMGGVTKISPLEACALAIKVGVNLLLYRDSSDETIKTIENLAELAKSDNELKTCINQSYEKITKFKEKYSEHLN